MNRATILNVSTVTPSTEVKLPPIEINQSIPKKMLDLSGLKYVPGQNKLQVFVVPINYDPNDSIFLDRTAEYISFAIEESNLTEKQFFIVPERFPYTKKDCPDMTLVQNMADDWHQRTFGMALPGRQMSAKIPIYKYRIVGIDSFEGSVRICGCGYAPDIYGPNAYVGGAKCSKRPEAMMHEVGHTMGLCDEYDTCTWEYLDAQLSKIRGVGCPNNRPNENNSICGNNCCSNITACCIGKYSDTKADNAYNIMGAVGSQVTYKTSTETKSQFVRYLCKYLAICGAGK